MAVQMTGFRRWVVAALAAGVTVVCVCAGSALAQTPAQEGAVSAPGPEPDVQAGAASAQGTETDVQAGAASAQGTETDVQAPARTGRRFLRPVLRVGHDLVLGRDSEVREVVVVLGNVELDGRVAGDVFVWFGDVRLAPTANIEGSLVVVAGDLTIPAAATVEEDLGVIGGRILGTEDYRPGREFVLIGPPVVGDAARSVVPWVLQGLLLGRPIVPSLRWVWTVVAISFGLALALTLIFGRAVQSSADVVLERPLRTFLTGLVVLIVTGPLLVIVAATVVGVVVLPIVLFGLLVAWTVGKVGVTRSIGHRVLPEGDPASRALAVRSVVIGFILLTLAYMVPLLGLVTWSLVSVFGLGAATIALLASLREEYPRTPRKARAPSGPEPDRGPGGPPSATAGAAAGLSMSGESAYQEVPPGPGAPSGTAPGADGLGPRAQFLERTAAFALDCVLIAIIDLLLDSRQDGMYFILLVAYHIAFWTWQGTTLGGIIVGLRVVRTDGEPLRFVDAFVRALAGVFSCAALGIGCFWMLRDPERQTWHDIIAGTYVIRVPREVLLGSTRPMGGAPTAGP